MGRWHNDLQLRNVHIDIQSERAAPLSSFFVLVQLPGSSVLFSTHIYWLTTLNRSSRVFLHCSSITTFLVAVFIHYFTPYSVRLGNVLCTRYMPLLFLVDYLHFHSNARKKPTSYSHTHEFPRESHIHISTSLHTSYLE